MLLVGNIQIFVNLIITSISQVSCMLLLDTWHQKDSQKAGKPGLLGFFLTTWKRRAKKLTPKLTLTPPPFSRVCRWVKGFYLLSYWNPRWPSDVWRGFGVATETLHLIFSSRCSCTLNGCRKWVYLWQWATAKQAQIEHNSNKTRWRWHTTKSATSARQLAVVAISLKCSVAWGA